MKNNNPPLYISRPTSKSMGNEYRIFEDRIELKSRILFKTFVISREDLVSIEIFKPPVIRTIFWALKLDMADLYEHVGIKRKTGWFKNLRFTPENPEYFVSKAKEVFQV